MSKYLNIIIELGIKNGRQIGERILGRGSNKEFFGTFSIHILTERKKARGLEARIRLVKNKTFFSKRASLHRNAE